MICFVLITYFGNPERKTLNIFPSFLNFLTLFDIFSGELLVLDDLKTEKKVCELVITYLINFLQLKKKVTSISICLSTIYTLINTW